MTAHYVQLNTLQAEQARVEGKLQARKSQLEVLAKEIIKMESRLKDLRNQISQIQKNNKATAITEHAYYRYFERILGYNMDEVRGWIIPPEIAGRLKTMGDGNYRLKNHTLIIKNNTVVTILHPDQQLRHK